MKKYTEECGLPEEKASHCPQGHVAEIEQGFQSLEHKLNTVPCSRGDFAFTTITFGQWDPKLSEEDRDWLFEIGRSILVTRREGHGPNHQPVVFPKLSFLYDQKQIDADPGPRNFLTRR